MFDVEQQLVRGDQIGTQYSGQAGTAITNPGTAQTGGRRMGSLASFAGTLSFNPSGNAAANITTYTNSASSDTSTANVGNLNIQSNGTQYYTGTFVNQVFQPVIYKQLVTTAEQRYNAKIRTMVVPTSLRTMISDNIVNSNTSINRRNVERGDTIQTYEGDFSYTYEIYDSWIMDQSGMSNSIYFLNEDVLQMGSLRDLGPNNEVFSNADASLDQYLMEVTLIVRNPAGVGLLNNISTTGAAVSAPRTSTFVSRTNSGAGSTY
jgi:hypothetical protein